jgi:hypothetical protein
MGTSHYITKVHLRQSTKRNLKIHQNTTPKKIQTQSKNNALSVTRTPTVHPRLLRLKPSLTEEGEIIVFHPPQTSKDQPQKGLLRPNQGTKL